MSQLSFDGRIATGDTVLDTGIDQLVIASVPGGGTVLYGATGGQGGISAWSLGADVPARIDTVYFPDWMASATAGALSLWDGGAGPQLLIGGVGGSDLLGYALTGTGALGDLTRPGDLAWNTAQIADIVTIGDRVFVADDGADMLSALTPRADGLETLWEGGRSALDGPADLATLRLGGIDYILATEPGTDGLAVFAVAESGALTRTDAIGLEGSLGISAPTAVAGVEAWDQGWVILAAAGTQTLTVLQLDTDGMLNPIGHWIDTRETRFGTPQALEVVTVGGRVLVIAGGGDDGLAVLTLLPDGRLLHLQSLTHETGLGLMDITAITAAVVGDRLEVFVASEDAGGLSRFSMDLGSLGDTVEDRQAGGQLHSGGAGDDLLISQAGADTLRGAAGDDILVGSADGATLTGGAGADLFVPGGQTARTRITDFELGTDRIDLSGWTMLRGPGQLSIAETGTGARITYRDAVIEVTRAGGGSLSADDLFGTAFSWPDAIPIIDEPLGMVLQGATADDEILGGALADTLTGGAGDDTNYGGDGADQLDGGAGNDLLGGGAGGDTLDGGGGNDAVFGAADGDRLTGGDGADTLGGGAGDDTILGDGGRDEVWTSDGSDWADGGGGNDTLGGFWGHDTLLGGDGHDEIWGAGGDDSLEGGTGDDTLGGSVGRDTLWGGDGADELWGADGADQLDGGAGNDALGAGAGNDLADGGAGNDAVWGGTGDDTVGGGAGNDTVGGASGNDTLMGGDGADTLYAGAGDDWLDGGGGDDLLSGADGADVFVFAAGHGSDRVTDFTIGEDRLDLSALGLSGFSALSVTTWDGAIEIALEAGTLTLEGIVTLGASDILF